MATLSRAVTIAGDGPHAGWDLHVSHIEHDVDQMEDLYALTLWAPGAAEPTHRFDTYRYGFGWSVLNAALVADDEDVDAPMQTAADWWTQHNTSIRYQIHRILVAVDDTTWATRDEVTERIQPPAVEQPGGPVADALDTAARHGLLTWHNLRGAHPYAALTPAGYDLIHPDDQAAAEGSQRDLAIALAGENASQLPPTSAAGRAFTGNMKSTRPSQQPAATLANAPTSTRQSRPTR